MIKPSIFKVFSYLRKKSPPTGGQVKRLPHILLCDSPQWGDADVIVTSGVGYYGPPIRVATISEIVVIDFK